MPKAIIGVDYHRLKKNGGIRFNCSVSYRGLGIVECTFTSQNNVSKKIKGILP
jgi:hypothetical protein